MSTVARMGVVWTAVSFAAVVLAGAPWPVVFLPVTLGRLRRDVAAVMRREPDLRKSLRPVLLASMLR